MANDEQLANGRRGAVVVVAATEQHARELRRRLRELGSDVPVITAAKASEHRRGRRVAMELWDSHAAASYF